MSTISSNSALGNLIAWNQPAASTAPTTSVAEAQQTLAQTPATILSALTPANTSLYGAATAVDSLLGNIATSASLNALSQINASRSASSQINPFPTVANAVNYAQQSEADSKAELISSALNSVGSTSAILNAYFPIESSTSTASPQINVTG